MSPFPASQSTASATRSRPSAVSARSDEEDFVLDAEQREVGADQVHHRGDCERAHHRQPLLFRLIQQRAPWFEASTAPTGFR